MAGQKRKPPARDKRQPSGREKPVGLRIVGGTFRGRKLQYAGDLRVRPMKDRVREAVFNLVGPSVRGAHAMDLFAGTGALGLEAISRGAAGATFIECHYPTARVLRANIATLAVEPLCRVVVADTFAWWNQSPCLSASAWVAFVSPPYDFYIDRREDMLRLIHGLRAAAPPGSVLVVESDQRFDFASLDSADGWNVRDYPPARVGLYRNPVPSPSTPNP